MRATDIILFSSLCTIMKKVCVKFDPNRIFSFEEKVEQVDGQTDGLSDKRMIRRYRRIKKLMIQEL